MRFLVAIVMFPIALACSPTHGPPSISIDPTTVLVSDRVRIAVTGLEPDQVATLTVETADATGHTWSSSATFHADGNGNIDLRAMKPKSGSYAVADGMGLFWSMAPQGSSPLANVLQAPSPTEVDGIALTVGGRVVATKTLYRQYVVPGVTVSTMRTPGDAFYGDFFSPGDTSIPRPGILDFGGSEGGLSGDLVAAQLASHGYPALAIAYFKEPGLPQELSNVPLEYFVGALKWLGAQPGVDPRRLIVEGVSRGGEAALLLGSEFPDVIHGVVALVPSAWVNCAFPKCDGAAWTLDGRPIPFTGSVSDADALIPVNRINGPLLVDCGGLDSVWLSCSSAHEIKRELAAGFRFPFTSLEYPDAGHGIGSVIPYTAFIEPAANQGRTPASDPLAREQVWPQLLRFLAAAA